MIDLSVLVTESRNKETMGLDQMTPLEIVTVMNREDGKAVEAVEEVLPQIAQAIAWCTDSLKQKGRIIYIGAGTSGRLGVLDAVECPPTFGVSPDVVVGLMAGGSMGEEDLKEIHLSPADIVIGLAASGRTPYVIYGLRYAKKIGCRTVAVSCNRDSEIGKEADLAIEPVPGPEVLTGSTRLKAGTVQKMVLNMISTGSMVGIGKVYQNLMVDVVQTNMKLITRAENIVMTATGCTREEARDSLEEAEGSVKLAITMILLQCGAKSAKTRLNRAGGYVRNAIQDV